MKFKSIIFVCVLTFFSGEAEAFAFDKTAVPEPESERAREVPGLEWAGEVPEPVFEGNRDFVQLYYTAWKQAYDHIKVQEGIPHPRYIDEACWDDTIWIWDTEFMALFCKYSPKVFPGVESLGNFYSLMLDNATSILRIQHPDNPPFFSWIEYEYYKFTADKDHLRTLVNEKKYPQRYFRMFEQLDSTRKFNFDHHKVELQKTDKGYRWGNIQSGMDNTPRVRAGAGMLWVDAISQQALSALYNVRLAELAGNKDSAREFRREYRKLKRIINKYYWDSRDHCYYDLKSDGTLSRVLTPASFWPVLAELPTREQARKMAAFALADGKLGGERPWKTVSADDPEYVADYGEYWKGSVWLPTAYMGIKALEKYKMYELADETAEKVLTQMSRSYNDFTPHTIWECYNPSGDTPAKNGKGRFVRTDFCGWSALGPISLFIENVIGIKEVNADKALVRWDIHHSFEHGLKNLRFSDTVTSLIYKDGVVSVDSNKAYRLIINGRKHCIKPGHNEIK